VKYKLGSLIFAKLMKAARCELFICDVQIRCNGLPAWFKEARGCCNRCGGCNDRPTQFSGVEVENRNWNYGISALSYAPSRFGLLRHCRRFARCAKIRKHFVANVEVFCCFTVVISLPGNASVYHEDKWSAVAGRM